MHNLITFACGHFVLLPSSSPDLLSPALRSSAIEDLWYLSDSAETDLGQTATDRHVKSSEPCTNCADTVEYPSMQRMRALKDVRMLRRLYTECKLNYLTSAGRYQLLDFSQKVKFVRDERCALAHTQAWIERRVRSEDPFFASFDDFLILIDEAQALLLP